MGDYDFHEPFGPVYVAPTGGDCPDCECCTKALCDHSRRQESPFMRDCQMHSGNPGLVRGCPCPNAEVAR